MVDQLTEEERVFKWRMERYLSLDFTVAQAERLADADWVDWHRCQELRERLWHPDHIFAALY